MATTGTKTNQDICLSALRKATITAGDEPATGDDMVNALESLGSMLKSWQNEGFNLWAVSDLSLPITAGVNNQVVTPRPHSIHNIRFQSNGVEIPMERLNRTEWDELPQKTTSGTPTTFYVDRQRDSFTVRIWPVLSVVTTETLEITYVRELEDVEAVEVVDVPSEWLEATIYGLAARLADDYGLDKPMLVRRAERELELAQAQDREGSIYFLDEYA